MKNTDVTSTGAAATAAARAYTAALLALAVCATPSWARQADGAADVDNVVQVVDVVSVCVRYDAETESWAAYSATEDGICDMIGSRGGARPTSDSAVPVSVIQGDDLRSLGDPAFDYLLASAEPSFNVSQGPDGAILMRSATLRGLAPDATLVLVNGKRRHRGAIIALLGYGMSSGAQGADLAAIPAVAIERVEVLRDGASAQYGSDAIAGAVNVVLRSAREGASADARWRSAYEGDGDGVTVAGNVGMALGATGWANLSVEWKEGERTVRSIQRADAQALVDAGNTATPAPVAQVWGAPRLLEDLKLFATAGFDLGQRAEAYALGNWAERQSEGGFYYRNPHTHDGIFRGPPLDDGTLTVKVADLTPDGSGNCPPLPVIDDRVDAQALAAVRANPHCYSPIERFPGGFTPQFGGMIDDASLTAGVRGNTEGGWRWDASGTVGRSSVAFYIYDTVNTQLLGMGDDIPTHYRVGAYTELDRVANVDFSKPFDAPGFHGDLNMAFGFEYRDETFEVDSGEPNSYYLDPNLEHGLAAQGFSIGTNGFQGFRPDDAGRNTASAHAAYVDVEGDLLENLLLGSAVRYENHADFGDTLDGKLVVRWRIASAFAVRASASSGFRVPTAGQADLRNVATQFVTEDGEGRVVDVAILPPTNPIAARKGALPLTPERSINLAFGVLSRIGPIDIALDYYHIAIEDRISFTSTFALTPDDVDALLAAGVADAQDIRSVRFFANQQDVNVQGVDASATWQFDLASGVSALSLAANFSDIDLVRYNPDFTSAHQRLAIEEGRPGSRWTAAWTYDRGRWRLTSRIRNYGEYYDAPNGGGGWGAFRPSGANLLDAELAVDVGNGWSFAIGGENLLDDYPDQNPNRSVPAFNGLPYPENSPFGFNGGAYYIRATWQRS